MTRYTVVVMLATILILTLSGCEVATTVKLRNGPSFALRGSGRLASFRIYAPRPGHKIATPFDTASLVWLIEPSGGYFEGEPVRRMHVVYGSVPTGYKQAVPSSSNAAPLPSGEVYYFLAETTNAPPAAGFFYLDGSTPIEIKVPGLCQSGFVGDVKSLKCGSSEPYAEPNNLEQFVKENRIQK